MSRFAKASAVALSMGVVAQAGDWESRFDEFLEKFEKKYHEPAEWKARFEAFVSNSMHIEAENAKGNSWTLGINEFADMTPEEFGVKYNGYRPSTGKLWSGATYLGTFKGHQRDLAGVCGLAHEGCRDAGEEPRPVRFLLGLLHDRCFGGCLPDRHGQVGFGE
jgi:hypothetical protein